MVEKEMKNSFFSKLKSKRLVQKKRGQRKTRTKERLRVLREREET